MASVSSATPFRGKAKMTARVGLAMEVMMALALGHLRAGRKQQMRTLVGAIPVHDTGLSSPPRRRRNRPAEKPGRAPIPPAGLAAAKTALFARMLPNSSRPWRLGAARRQQKVDADPASYLTKGGPNKKMSTAQTPRLMRIWGNSMNSATSETLAGTALVDGIVARSENNLPIFLFRQTREGNKSFQFSRALCEALIPQSSDTLLTRARTDRQQRNRAFAAEFLAPSSGLRGRVPRSVLGDDDIDEIAAEYGVSPLVMAHQIRNHEIAEIR